MLQGKVCAHAVGVCVHLPSHWPLTLWWILIRYLGTQDHCDIQVSTVYLPQVSLGTHLSTNTFVRMNSCVNCVPTILIRNQTWTSGFIVRHADHCTTEMLKCGRGDNNDDDDSGEEYWKDFTTPSLNKG